MLKTHTEFVDIEFADLLIPLAHRDVEKYTQAPVSFTQEFLGWERIIETPRQGTFIHRRGNQRNGKRTVPVASGPARLLIIFFKRRRRVEMHHYAHIGFVDSHTERRGGHHHPDSITLPTVLLVVFLFRRQPGMIKVSTYTCLAQNIGHHTCAFPRPDIHYAATRHTVKNMYKLLLLEVAVPYYIRKVVAVETQPEHTGTGTETKLLANIPYHFGSGRGGQSQQRRIGKHIPQ